MSQESGNGEVCLWDRIFSLLTKFHGSAAPYSPVNRCCYQRDNVRPLGQGIRSDDTLRRRGAVEEEIYEQEGEEARGGIILNVFSNSKEKNQG